MNKTAKIVQIIHCGHYLERCVWEDDQQIQHIKINDAFYPLHDFVVLMAWQTCYNMGYGGGIEMSNEYGLRDDTYDAMLAGLGTVENYYLDKVREEPITEEEAIEEAILHMEEETQFTSRLTTAIRFDGHERIKAAMRKEIPHLAIPIKKIT